MENTYTYTARSVTDPEKIVTFTLHDDQMTVGVGSPLEQIEAAIAGVTSGEEEAVAEDSHLWLRPLAISLIERGTGPFSIADIDAEVEDAYLTVRGWIRVAGLRGGVITLMEGQVDNPIAARAFAHEVQARKDELAQGVLPLDYWITWLGMVASLVTLFVFWRRRASTRRAGAANPTN
jgi:hypothetical protein